MNLQLRSRRRKDAEFLEKSEVGQHEANELPRVFPLPIRWGEGSRERGSLHCHGIPQTCNLQLATFNLELI
jgi:hypothetical protein